MEKHRRQKIEGLPAGIRVADQTETTVQVANTPGQPVKPGSMGRATPGYVVALVDPITGERKSEARLLTERESRRSFDLSRGPLLRAMLIRLRWAKWARLAR